MVKVITRTTYFRWGAIVMSLACFCANAISHGVSAQAPDSSATSGKIVRLDPSLDSIVGQDQVIEQVAENVGFTEGPLWTRDGALLFSDVRGNQIYRAVPGSMPAVFRSMAGYDGTEAVAPTALAGPNGLTFDNTGRLVICETGNRRVTRLEKNGDVTVLAATYNGKRLNNPNDVVTKSDGTIYFTDPSFGFLKGDTDPRRELTFNGVYRIRNGQTEVLSKELDGPNGIAFSPDEKYLYVSDSDSVKKTRGLARFEVNHDGTLAHPVVLLDLTGHDGQVPDGIKVDKRGNIYMAGPGGVWIVAPSGKAIGRLEPSEVAANLAWGDEGNSLYITARSKVFRVRLKTSGKRACCDMGGR